MKSSHIYWTFGFTVQFLGLLYLLSLLSNDLVPSDSVGIEESILVSPKKDNIKVRAEPIVIDAIATSKVTTTNSPTGGGGKAQRWMKSLLHFPAPWRSHNNGSKASALGFQSTTTTTCTASTNDTDIKKKRTRFRAFEAFRFYNNKTKHNNIPRVTPSRLVSCGFQLLSTSAGLLADSVKVTGDTAAGFVGSSVKLVGTGVRYAGAGIDKVGELLAASSNSSSSNSTLEVPSTKEEVEKQEPSLQFSSGKSKNKRQWFFQPKKPSLRRKRTLAAKSLHYLGATLELTGDSILVVGAAAESLAASTATVAEGTIRIVQDLAGTVSAAVSLVGRRHHGKQRATNNPNNQSSNATFAMGGLAVAPPFVSFGSYDPEQSTRIEDNNKNPWRWWMEQLFLAVNSTASEEVHGIPSGMATELAAALLLCHLMALLLLYPSNNINNDNNKQEKKSATPSRLPTSARQSFFVGLVQSPWRLATRWSRRMLLLCFYALVWSYLSRLSQQRVAAAHRRGEALGYRSGVASIVQQSSSLPKETLVWFNHALNNLWRIEHVPGGHASDEPQQHYHYDDYPLFVRRAFPQTRRRDGTSRHNTNGDYHSYGGLEPYISAAIGTGLVQSLEAAKATRPTDVAYVSLYSLSLGKRPPVIRSIQLANDVVPSAAAGAHTQQAIELDLDVDAFLEDFSMVFEVKLSSLSYALLPSTKIKIFDLDFRASVKAVLLLQPQSPFVSEVQLSMPTPPHCGFRAAPVSRDSGRNGVELGSLPFLNDWVREAIRTSLSSFVAPRYFALDVAELVHSNSIKQDQTPTVPNLKKSLRRRTSHPISTPRTSTPNGIAITSIADQLESRQSSMQAVGSNGKQPARNRHKKKQLLRPVVELSRLALDRHALKEENLVRPVTELARMGMERWLDSTVMKKGDRRNEEHDT